MATISFILKTLTDAIWKGWDVALWQQTMSVLTNDPMRQCSSKPRCGRMKMPAPHLLHEQSSSSLQAPELPAKTHNFIAQGLNLVAHGLTHIAQRSLQRYVQCPAISMRPVMLDKVSKFSIL
jgi:hypothetical protein